MNCYLSTRKPEEPAKAKAIRANSDAEVEVIRTLGHMAAETFPVDPEVVARTKQSFVSRLFRSQLNKEAIAKKAEQELRKTPLAADAGQQIDPDWLDMFSRHAETKSNEEMQTYFARLLAGEIKKPGSFVPATVEVLSRLTPDMARLFYRVCGISSTLHSSPGDPQLGTSATVMVITSPYGPPGSNAFASLGLPYVRFCDLQDAGIIQGDLNSTWSPSIAAFSTNTIRCAGHPIRFQFTEGTDTTANAETIKMAACLFTRAGRELRRLIELRPNHEYLTKLQEWLAKELRPHGLISVSDEAEAKASIE